MPLAFPSVNRGEVAFGFFNVDSDMLLLEQHFFFADAFCARVGDLAGAFAGEAVESVLAGHVIARPEDVGDLMGAIHGVRFTGFLGDTYRRYPFPARPEDFKQQPEGHETRDVLLGLIEPYAESAAILFRADPVAGEVAIGDVRFTRAVFQDLVAYVWRGGWPRWRDEVRPDYVLAMQDAIAARASNWLDAEVCR